LRNGELKNCYRCWSTERRVTAAQWIDPDEHNPLCDACRKALMWEETDCTRVAASSPPKEETPIRKISLGKPRKAKLGPAVEVKVGEKSIFIPDLKPNQPAPPETYNVEVSQEKSEMKRICKCGCGGEVPAANRFSYINGHRTRIVKPKAGAAEVPPSKDCARGCGKPKHRGMCKGARKSAESVAKIVRDTAPATAEPVAAVRVGARFLDSWWAALSLEQKAEAFSVQAQ
jgi:hypothetical protein